MQVHLVVPPSWTLLEAPPPGPCALAAWLQRAGAAVRIVDLNVEAVWHFASGAGREALWRHCAERLRALDAGPQGLLARIEHARLLRALAVLDDWGRAAEPPLEFLRSAAALAAPERRRRARRRVARLQGLLHALLRAEVQAERPRTGLAGLWTAAGGPPQDPLSHWLHERARDLLAAAPGGLVGISAAAPEQLGAALELGAALRRGSAGLPLLLGGAIVTREEDLLLGLPGLLRCFDALVVGEGESALLALWSHFAAGAPGGRHAGFERIPNLRFVPDAAVGEGSEPCARGPGRQERAADLPGPAFPGVCWERYLVPRRAAYLEASRGCYYGACAYCADCFAHAGHRRRSPAVVAAALAELAERHGVELVFFTDESLHPELAVALCAALGERSAPAWCVELRPEDAFDESLLGRLRRAGCRRVLVGVESLSEGVLQGVARGLGAAQAEGLVRRATAQGLALELFLVDGLPGEGEPERAETLRRLQALRLRPGSWVSVSPFWLDRLSPLGRHPARWGLTVWDPPLLEAADPAVFRVRGEDRLHAGRRATLRPLVLRPLAWPDWPVDGHWALAWLAAQGAAQPAGWSPPFEHHDPTALRDLHGRPVLAGAAWRVADLDCVWRLRPELVLVASGRDPLALAEELVAFDEALREAVAAGLGRAAAQEQALQGRDLALAAGPAHWHLLDLVGERWLQLDPLRAALLLRCDGIRSGHALVAEIAALSPDPPEQVRAGVARELGRLWDLGALAEVAPAAAGPIVDGPGGFS